VLLPLYCLLVLSTVYIQAHYVVDIIGGYAAAFIFYPLSKYLYPLFARKDELMANRQKI
jgi:membrane-associated phospholipid phosphatase